MFSKIKRETLRKSKIRLTKHEKYESEKSRPPSRLSIPPSCAAKLTQDMVAIINNPQGSDVQFKVGADGISTLQGNDKTTYGESATVTLYAHSLILRCRSRYFTNILDEEKNWRESSECVIYKPYISSSTFQDVLYYIYTGYVHVRVKHFQSIMELIAAAKEMDLEGLGTECQAKLLHKVENILSNEYDSDEEDDSGKILEGPINRSIPINVAIGTYVIPALNLASSHSLSEFSQKLIIVIVSYMPKIIKSPRAYDVFIDKISSEDFAKIIESDDLEMAECCVWDLTLDWACYQAKLSKTLVRERLSIPEDDEEDGKGSSSGTKIDSTQLNQLKRMVAPLLPAIRFSLFKPDYYACMVYTINYFLPRRQSLELQKYFMKTGHMRQLDAPRMENARRNMISSIIGSAAWKFLRKKIFEIGGIVGCPFLGDLKFKLLFRGSEHGFLASAFHRRCDNKGPTLVIVKDIDGRNFGGVNFNHWKSNRSYTSSPLNFFFVLPDGRHRNDSAFFTVVPTTNVTHSSYNGATFGSEPHHLYFADSSNTQDTFIPILSHDRKGYFEILDYEIFSISK